MDGVGSAARPTRLASPVAAREGTVPPQTQTGFPHPRAVDSYLKSVVELGFVQRDGSNNAIAGLTSQDPSGDPAGRSAQLPRP